MNNHLLLVLLLLGHVLGDFYLQPVRMAAAKDAPLKGAKWGRIVGALIGHGIIYSAVICVLFIFGTDNSVGLIVWTCLSHFAIDFAKFLIFQTPVRQNDTAQKLKFAVDQSLHIAVLIILWRIYDPAVAVLDPLSGLAPLLPAMPVPPIVIILCLLCGLKPASMFVKTVLEFIGKPDGDEPGKINDEKMKQAGKMIGYLERTIIFFLILCNQFGAIGFVITAKTVARFSEIRKENAEYYLIGTLSSIAAIFIISFLLGIWKIP